MSAMATTNIWNVEKPRPGADARDWWVEREKALRVIVGERQAMGCDCDAPPWISPPDEWPLKIRLDHAPWCATPPPDGPVTSLTGPTGPPTLPAA